MSIARRRVDHDVFEREFAIESLKSERLRVTILMGAHVFKGFLLFLMGVVTGFVTIQIRKRILNAFSVVQERNRISRTFGEYVSPEVMSKLLDLKPDLRSESKNVCVMFLDIRNFTGLIRSC